MWGRICDGITPLAISSAVPRTWRARSVVVLSPTVALKFQLFRNFGALAAGAGGNVAFTGRGRYCFLGRVF